MITGTKTINPLVNVQRAAIDVAAACYAKWQGDVSFVDDLTDYLRNGLVIARPDIFGMAKIVDWKGEPAWFVRIAVGDLRTLIAELPAPTRHICFCRRNDGRLRAYPMARMIHLVTSKGKGV